MSGEEEINISFPEVAVEKFGFGITREQDEFYSYYPLHGNTEPNAVFALNFPGLALKSEPYALFA